MRFLAIVVTVVCLAVLPTVANAAGQVPDATLAQVGLSGMHQMTDAQGLDVRGSGFAAVSGWSWATVPFSSGSGQQYSAVSSPHHGSALATGGSNSAASSSVSSSTSTTVTSFGFGMFGPYANTVQTGISSSVIFGAASGGSAFAYAK